MCVCYLYRWLEGGRVGVVSQGLAVSGLFDPQQDLDVLAVLVAAGLLVALHPGLDLVLPQGRVLRRLKVWGRALGRRGRGGEREEERGQMGGGRRRGGQREEEKDKWEGEGGEQDRVRLQVLTSGQTGSQQTPGGEQVWLCVFVRYLYSGGFSRALAECLWTQDKDT